MHARTHKTDRPHCSARIYATVILQQYPVLLLLTAMNCCCCCCCCCCSPSLLLLPLYYCCVQTLSGTGACRVIGELLGNFQGKDAAMYLPDPTWGNHIPIFKNAGMAVKRYRYYDPKTCGLDFEGERCSSRSIATALVYLLAQ
jgi:Aminotransferase class I and II